ncbi:MAG TPA: hypothetical protein VMN57_06635 [Anaerolineales bacterium]|nr:hypothetical protein [Anaerolineales bacterium]
MLQESRLRLVKPTLQTPFHIDFEWWKQNDRSWQVYLKSYLSDEVQESLRVTGDDQLIDIIDSQTGEVHQVEALQHMLILHCANRDDFITETTSVTESIFRLLLSNGNAPLTAVELGERLGREPVIVLRMLSGARVYKGIRPRLSN